MPSSPSIPSPGRTFAAGMPCCCAMAWRNSCISGSPYFQTSRAAASIAVMAWGEGPNGLSFAPRRAAKGAPPGTFLRLRSDEGDGRGEALGEGGEAGHGVRVSDIDLNVIGSGPERQSSSYQHVAAVDRME